MYSVIRFIYIYKGSTLGIDCNTITLDKCSRITISLSSKGEKQRTTYTE